MSYKKTKEPHKLMMKAGWMEASTEDQGIPQRAPSPAAGLPRSPRCNLDTQAQGVKISHEYIK